jgi:hypothetical protein
MHCDGPATFTFGLESSWFSADTAKTITPIRMGIPHFQTTLPVWIIAFRSERIVVFSIISCFGCTHIVFCAISGESSVTDAPKLPVFVSVLFHPHSHFFSRFDYIEGNGLDSAMKGGISDD